MDRVWVLTEAFFSSPITWGVVALLALTLALSGKLSMTAATWVLWLAVFTALFGVYRAEAMLKMDALMRCLIFGCCAFGFAAGAVALNRWMNSPKEPEISTSSSPHVAAREKSADTPKETPVIGKSDAKPETHGTMDKVEAKPKHPGSVSAEKQPAETKTVEAPPPQTIIQAPSYGNLRARANELADDIMKNICQGEFAGVVGRPAPAMPPVRNIKVVKSN
jgi:hypothetical protein